MTTGQAQLAERTGGETELHEKLASFLETELAKPEHRTCVAITLEEDSDGRREDPFLKFDRTDEPHVFEHGAIRDLVMRIVNAAEEYVDMRGSAVPREGLRFILRTRQHLGGRERKMFVVRPLAQPTSGTLGAGGLSPTMEGVLALQMRQNEKLFDGHQQLMIGTTGVLLAQITRLQGDQAKNEATIERLKRELDEARDASDQRMMEAVSLEKSDARKDALFAKLMQFSPVVLAMLTGKSKQVGAPTPRDFMMSELAASLLKDPPRMNQIVMMLTVPERALFGQIIQSIPATPDGNTGEAQGAAT